MAAHAPPKPEFASATRTDDQSSTTPHEHVLEELATRGQLPESDLAFAVPYSAPACRRLVEELESRGRVTRRHAGGETVVCLRDGGAATSVRSE